MKFLVDMALSPELAQWLNGEGHDAAHAGNIGLGQASDHEILRVAAIQERVIVTADLDFPRLLAILGAEGPGLILLRGGNYSEAESLDCVRRVLHAVELQDLPRSVIVVDHEKVRRRALPL